MLISARFDDGSEMSDSEIRDQLMTLLLAGHETTATALAWAFDLLFRNPERTSAWSRRSGRATITPTSTPSSRRRSASGRSSRSRAASCASRPRSTASTSSRGRSSSPRSGSPTRGPTSIRSRSHSGPSASSTVRPRPTRGCRSAAGRGAASAPLSPSSRCGWRFRRSSANATCGPASAGARAPIRRNVTMSPAKGTPAVMKRVRQARVTALSPNSIEKVA